MKIIKYTIAASLLISSGSEANNYIEKKIIENNPYTSENYDLATLDMLSLISETMKEKVNIRHQKNEYDDIGESASNFNRSGPSGVDNSVTISSTNNKPDFSGNGSYFNNHYNNYYNNFYNNNYNNNYNNHYNNDYNNNYNNNHHNNNNNGNNNGNNNNNDNNNKNYAREETSSEAD